jgi:23S rRNA (cytidine2498-2'-O)-methyltransferase
MSERGHRRHGAQRPRRGRERAAASERPHRGGERPAAGERPHRGRERPAANERPHRGWERPAANERPPRGGERPAAAPPRPHRVGPPRAGEWLFTTREGAEVDLVEELELRLGPGAARVLAPALVRAHGAPTAADGALDVTFGRQGFPVDGEVTGEGAAALAAACAPLVAAAAAPRGPWGLQVFTPDTAAGNGLSSLADTLRAATLRALDPAVEARCAEESLLRVTGGRLVQLCLADERRALVGATDFADALSPWPGGRARMRVSGERPSRAARKLEEALAWLGVAPVAGEECVDLGAAPGGWSWVLLQRGARVVAVDPARLQPDLLSRRGLAHRQVSAFTYAPDEPMDWLFCDMAWRPLEVAALLAKWGRRRWARMLVANLKLPMKRKAEMVARLRDVVAGGGWQRVRTRQLYHDRDECTLVAYGR